MQSLLCSGPGTNPMIGEVVFLRGIVETYGRSLLLYDLHTKDYFDDRDHLRRHCAQYVDQFLDLARQKFGEPAFLVLKHPQLTPLFPLLHELLPAAKFVVTLRDPRDTIASAVRARNRGATEFGDMTPLRIAAVMNGYYMNCLRCSDRSFHQQTAYVTYENLVRDPSAVVKILGAFTGIDLSPVETEEGVKPADWEPDGSKAPGQPFHSELYGKEISPERVGRYAETLSEQDALEIERICREIFEIYRAGPAVFQVAMPKETGDGEAPGSIKLTEIQG